MSFLEDLAKSAVGPIAGLLGVHSSNSAARDAARESREAQKELYQHRYQWSRADMKAAGLNPILMASQGPGAFPTTAQAQVFDGSAAIDHGASALAKGSQKMLLREQINTEKDRQASLAAEANLKQTQQTVNQYEAELKRNTYRQMQQDNVWGDLLRTSAAARDAGLTNTSTAVTSALKNSASLLPKAKLGAERAWPFLKRLPKAMERSHMKKYHNW